MHAIYLVSVWLHICAAAVWIGGMVFFVIVLVPLLRQPELRGRSGSILHWIGIRFRTVGWVSFGVLIATGIFNLYVRGVRFDDLFSKSFWSSDFGSVLAVKLVLVAAILILSALHDFVIGPRATRLLRECPGSVHATRLRGTARWIGRANLLLALAVVALAVALVRGG